MLTCLLLKVLGLTRVWNAGLGQNYAEKARAPSSRKVRYVCSIAHACAFFAYILNLSPEETCVVQVETGDTGFAADGNASASGL